ncbi:MAG: metallophosphatase family protein [Proteobacteria bacterium]|nr:metallophosphatase family protein [Pseudomonadota bacterium]
MLHRIGILSDTHGLLRPEVLSAIADCDIIFHAGDIGDLQVLHVLGKIAPVHAVKGNTDKGKWTQDLPLIKAVDVCGHYFYILHEIEDLDLDPAVANLNMVIFGHTHRAQVKQQDSIFYLNPGSAGPRRSNLPVTIAKVTVNSKELIPEIIRFDL